MKKTNYTSTITSLIIIALISIQGAFAQMNVQWADTLNKALNSGRQAENMQGVASAVVFSDGSVWSAASGNAGNTPLSTNFLYDIGSNTKSMVAAVIMLLEEELKLSINDTLYQHISPIANIPSGITLKHLLGHRSGIFDFTRHPNFASNINGNETKFWHPDSLLSNFLNAPKFTAGSKFEYSNTNYLLLGKVIEAIEQKPFNVVLRDRLFTPLGLTNMYLDQYDTYSQVKIGAWLSPTFYYGTDFVSFMSAAWAAGAVVSTPEDFALWASNLFGGQVLDSNSLNKMRIGSTLQGGSVYGLGIIERYYKGKTYLSHGGTTLQNSEMDYSLSSGFSLVVMNIDQGFGSETARLRDKLVDLLEYIEQQASSISVAEEALIAAQIEVYPNPSNSQMVVSLSSDSPINEGRIELMDMNGRIIHKAALSNGSVVLNNFEIGKGIYFARFYNGHELMGTKKVIFN